MANSKHSVLGANFTVDEDADVELDGPDGVSAIGLAMTVVAHADGHNKTLIEFTYGATATDNGIAGDLSGTPGVVFKGPAGLYTIVKAKVEGVNVLEGAIIAPEQEDFVSVGLYVNSALWAIADEGFSAEEALDTETGTVFNVSETSLALTENDVIRVALIGLEANEETLGFDIGDEGTLEIK